MRTDRDGPCVLLTATIAPAGAMPNQGAFDPRARMAQYAAALRHYLTTSGPDWTVLFCENSGQDLAPLREVAAACCRPGRDARFHAYRSPVPPERGKGRSELELIDTAMRVFDDAIGASSLVWKVTGRLRVENLGALVASAPAGTDLYADVRDVPLIGDRLGGNHWIDTRVIAFSKAGHARFLADRWTQSWKTIEKYLYAVVTPNLAPESGIVPRFRVQPIVTGICGGSGSSYGSVGYRAKTALRATTRRVAPGLWL